MKKSKKFWRGLFFLFLIAALCVGMAVPFLAPVQAAPVMQAGTNIVISEFRFRGPNGGNDEFIELYNPTSLVVDISGWLIRGSNNAGSTSTRATIPVATTLQPGQYYLVVNNSAAGYSGSVAGNLPYTTGITDDGGVAITLADTTTIIDAVGLSVGSAYLEGTDLTPLVSNTNQSYEREIGGSSGSCIDSNNNSSDFQLLNPSNPQNSSSIIPCSDNVIINEVAWAGTIAFAGDEWIELYNAGSASVDLTNWRIEAADGSPSISLSGILSPNSYLLLERGSQNVTNVSGVVYPGSAGLLDDAGEMLYLRDDASAIVDSANSNGGAWPSGSGSPDFRSMERIGVVADTDLSWVTFAGTPSALDAGNNAINGTPGGVNWGLNMVPTFTPTASLTATLTFTSSPTNTGTPTNTATPSGFLSLVINEVAWMGTAASTSDEWIELYNPGLVPINLTGWILKGVDGSPLINLTGTIAAGGYFLLERTDDTTISNIVADQIYTGELANTSEILQLFDPGNKLIDSANSNGSSWPAGSSSTFGSMERRGVIADSDTAWITNTGVVKNGLNANGNPILGTPRQSNWALTVTATPSATPTLTKAPTKFNTSTPKPAPPPELVAINEFVPRPGRDWNNDGAVNTGDEYIEIINFGTVSVNLSGYTLDDEVNVGSSPYSLPSVTLDPGERVVFYGSKTNLLLSDGGDGVRLLKPNGQLADAFNYTVVNYPDQSFCRLPDNGGLDDWSRNCFPTPGLGNSLGGNIPSPVGGIEEPSCPIADTLPLDFFLAECEPFGHNIWSRPYWDDNGWYGEKNLTDSPGRWETFVD
jgi:hypothetical protein